MSVFGFVKHTVSSLRMLASDFSAVYASIVNNKFESVIAYVSILLFAGGCVIPIPADENKVLSGIEVKEEQMSILQVGNSTKNTVIRQIGKPYIILKDHDVFIYQWGKHNGAFYYVIPNYFGSYGGVVEMQKYYLLLMQFDSNDKLIQYNRFELRNNDAFADFVIKWICNQHLEK